MFKILQKTVRTGTATRRYPEEPAMLTPGFRGLPEFNWANLRDPGAVADACPAEAIAVTDAEWSRTVALDYGRCNVCGECAAADPDAVRMSRRFEAAATHRKDLVTTAEYTLDTAGRPTHLVRVSSSDSARRTGERLTQQIRSILGRSLAIREVDAGSCNACELEIGALNNPVHDIERFGIHFVASPRHADMLLVTGPVTRNMELALRKTYDATPDPKIVVAVGACGISGGMFGINYATRGGVDKVIPVDVYVPGCPPRPEALLYGILLAVGRLRPQR